MTESGSFLEEMEKEALSKKNPLNPDLCLSRQLTIPGMTLKRLESNLEDKIYNIYPLDEIDRIPKNIPNILKESINEEIYSAECMNTNFGARIFDILIYHFPGQDKYLTRNNLLEIQLSCIDTHISVTAKFHNFKEDTVYTQLQEIFRNQQYNY